MSTTLSHPNFHRWVIRVGSFLLVACSCFLITAPLLIPDFPIYPTIFGREVPLRYQRVMVVLIGSLFLIEGLLLVSLSWIGWWLAITLGVVFIANGLVSSTRFWPTLIDVLIVFYLYYSRELFVRAPQSAPTR